MALHAALITWAHAPKVDRAYSYPESPFWMESAPPPEPEPEPEKPPPPQPPTETAPAQKPKVQRGPAKPRLPTVATVSTQTGLSIEATDASQTASGQGSDAGGTATDAAAYGGSVPARSKPTPQFSLWLRPPELQQLVIVRAPTALLQAVPGYRALLRGSDVAAFSNLDRLRVFLPGLSAERLVLAGVHSGGEAEVVRAAERVASTRERVPTWRGSSELRAAAWIDGSGFDRGLAVHGAAFLIGGRAQLPGLLGEQAPGTRVDKLSLTRPEVLFSAVLRNVEHYLPVLASCQLRTLSISITRALRISLSAELDTDADASRVRVCAANSGDSSELRYLSELLGQAVVEPGRARMRLNTGATSEEISRLLDELCWALRRITRS